VFAAPTVADCNFENGFCSWKQATDDLFDWSLGKGDTQTLQTGPVNDHTLQNGELSSLTGYIYLYVQYMYARSFNF